MVPSPHTLVLRGAAAAVLAGLAFVAEAAAFALVPVGYYRQGFAALAAALLAIPTMIGIHALLRDRYGDLGAIGFTLSVGGLLGQAAGLVLGMLRGAGFPADRTEGLLYTVGFLAFAVGLLVLGVAWLLAGALPLWPGVVLVVLGPQSLLPYPLPWLSLAVLGVGLVAVGVGLAQARDDEGLSRERPDRTTRGRDGAATDEDDQPVTPGRSRFDRPPFRRKASSD